MNHPNQPPPGAGTAVIESSAPTPPPTTIAPPSEDVWPVPPVRAAVLLGCVMLGYVGIYLCRKNLSVAIPMIQDRFGATKAQVGMIASYSTYAYAIGKILFGPVIDRFGGRPCFLFALAGVALFGGAGALSLSLPMLAVCYSANRFTGAAGWGSMVKQVPDWFPPRHLALAMAFLSLSFVFGGVLALLLAGRIDTLTHHDWRAVMGLPSVVLIAILLLCRLILPATPSGRKDGPGGPAEGVRWKQFIELTKLPQFWIVCALSFTLSITRETFNTWTVDFMKTVPSASGTPLSTEAAAFLSTPFDAAGAVGILLLGWTLDHLSARGRRQVLFTTLALLALLIYFLPDLCKHGKLVVAAAVGLIGFLSYGPYSLLAGIFSVEIRGKEYVATVAGLVDASGYLSGIVSGYIFGKILDRGGYTLGFDFLAVITFVAAVLCLFLRGSSKRTPSPA